MVTGKRPLDGMLTFGKLESLARAWLPWFFALFLAWVALEMTGSLERYSRFRVMFFQGPGQAVADGPRLPVGAAPADFYDGVKLIDNFDRMERRDGDSGKSFMVAVFGQGFPVDGDFSGSSREKANARGSRFTTARGPDKICFTLVGHFFNEIGLSSFNLT